MPYKGNRSDFKFNYIQKVKDLLPAVYIEDDLNNGVKEELTYKVLGKTMLVAQENTSFLSVSSFSASDTRAYFIPYNRLTRVTPQIFQEHVLARYNKTWSSFRNEGDFRDFLTNTIQPDIVLNSPSVTFVASATSAPFATVSSAGDVHDDLVSSLGAMYFLNSSGVTGATTLSSLLTSYIVSSVYRGKTFTESDAMQCMMEYTFINRGTVTDLNRYLPFEFQSASSVLSAGVYTSGTQYISNLKELVDTWYTPQDEDSTFLSDAFGVLDNSGTLPTLSESSGPLFKFLKAISYGFYDLDVLVEEVADLLDIQRCPPEFLDYLANLVGWKLIGGDVDSWRAQLRQAVYIYKTKGTRKGLVDAISFVFPREITSFDASSDIKECYESYLPNLIYYALRTESPVCQDSSTLIPFIQEARQTRNVVYNLDGFDHDKNIRFCVDAILEELDKKFKFIEINDVHYKETSVYANQPLRNVGWVVNGSSTPGRGYEHRDGFVVAVPPWEVDRFYATTIITEELLDELKNILSECNEAGRYGISSAFLDLMIAYIKEKTGIATTDEVFYFGNNTKFKFFTSALEDAVNKDTVIASGNPEQVQVLDYWNTKSSHLFIAIDVSGFTNQGLDSLTPAVISNISQTFREFTPFHATTRIYLGISIDDSYYGYVDSICFWVIPTWHDPNTVVLESRVTSGWVGTSGIGNWYSSIPDVRSGRYLPSSTDGFWTIFSGGLERTNTRRRNLRYSISGERFNRNGKAQPIAPFFFGSWQTALETTTETIHKGFNFSGQHFIDPTESVTLSGIYNASNTPEVSGNTILYSAPSSTFLGVPISSTLNIRGVDDGDDCSAYTPTRELPSNFPYKIITERLIRLGEENSAYLKFDIDDIENLELGHDFHTLWNDYRTKFENNLDGSGFYALDHTYGPLFYNANMQLSGNAGDSITSSLYAYRDGSKTTLSSVQFHYIIGSDGIKDQSYRTQDGQLSIVSSMGLVWSKGWNTYRNELDIEEGRTHYTNRSQLSGMEFSFREGSNSLAVVNYPSVVDLGCAQRRFLDLSGVTFYGGREAVDIDSAPRMRLPLTLNRNYIRNSKFVNIPSTSALQDSATLGTLSDWYVTGGDLIEFSATSGTIQSQITPSSGYYALQFAGTVTFSALTSEYAYTDIKERLLANEQYTISYDVSSTIGGNTAWAITNKTKGTWYDATSDTWGTIVSGNYPVIADAIYGTVSEVITTASGADIDDEYRVYFGLESNKSVTSNFRYPKLTRTLDNALTSGTEYVCNMRLDSSAFGAGTNKVALRVVTGKKQRKGFYEYTNFFSYDFRRKRWMMADGEQYSYLTLNEGMNEVEFKFHTDNQYGPIDKARRKRLTEDRYTKVHDDDTSYYVEIIPILPFTQQSSDLLRPQVRLDRVLMRDLKYDFVYDNYTRYESKELLEFLDTFKTTLRSRDSAVSITFDMGANGGSKVLYLERWGGSNVESNTDGVTYYYI